MLGFCCSFQTENTYEKCFFFTYLSRTESSNRNPDKLSQKPEIRAAQKCQPILNHNAIASQSESYTRKSGPMASLVPPSLTVGQSAFSTTRATKSMKTKTMTPTAHILDTERGVQTVECHVPLCSRLVCSSCSLASANVELAEDVLRGGSFPHNIRLRTHTNNALPTLTSPLLPSIPSPSPQEENAAQRRRRRRRRLSLARFPVFRFRL